MLCYLQQEGDQARKHFHSLSQQNQLIQRRHRSSAHSSGGETLFTTDQSAFLFALQRAERDRKMLLTQVSELKTELVRRGSPKNILNDVTSKLTEIKNTVTNIKDGTPLGSASLHKRRPVPSS
jgi:hypothetical protein